MIIFYIHHKKNVVVPDSSRLAETALNRDHNIGFNKKISELS